MKNQLFQWNFVIKGLIPHQVKLKRKVWLKKGELLLEKKGDKLYAYLLGDDTDTFHNEERITPYLWISSLISNNAPDLEGGGGVGINSKDELGTKPFYSTSISTSIPDEAVADIENYAHKFIGFIGKLHDKYIDVVSENEFIKIALDYFYEAEKKFVYSNEGFISAVISMEALFNEGPSDIKYKLSHRAAFLLGLCDIDPIEAFEKLKDFYNKRSKLVHGGGTLPHDPDRYLVSKYTRRSIIIFLILLKNEERRKVSRKKRKIEILKEIDYAMLNEDKLKSLKKEINKGLKDFKLTIPRTFEGRGKHGNYRITAW
ncbi:hypothetical protein KKG29_05940 [Patescibacteria group bacterium]|nr:hypothetical protein [Desulfobacteraceae bacterium]MBU4000677.1 hypothetical protein [Patescibacteria group bacterium]MBU4068733.1 hypothetical protein [Pseudomonadota bacterium]MBU4100684.1 hypothetical protein [Pseudomonadota bacterium]MBU4127600.1 hypothetical protein [Pseudomonadota bacterium]